MRTDATAISITSFVDGLSDTRSSASPTANIRPQHASSRLMSWTTRNARRPQMTVRPIATPPKSAIGFLCQRSSRGCATAPKRTASILATGTSANESEKAKRNGQVAAFRARLRWGKSRLFYSGSGLRGAAGPGGQQAKPLFEAQQAPQLAAVVGLAGEMAGHEPFDERRRERVAIARVGGEQQGGHVVL